MFAIKMYMSCFLVLLGLYSIQAVGDNYYRFGDRHNNEANSGYHYFEKIEKPCSVHDVHCIRNYLAQTFGCAAVYKHYPEPSYYVKSFLLDMPNGNASAVVSDIELYGLNSGTIKTFYINKKTDSMVLEVVFDSILMKSPHAVVSYYQPGKEPIKKEDYIMFNFRYFSLTWIVEGIHDNNLRNSHVYAYMTDRHPDSKVGHKLFATNGQGNGWISNMNLSIAEAMTTQGPMLLTAFMKSNMCDLQL